jgi:hypothetical protein
MIAPAAPRPLAAEGVAIEPVAVEICELVKPIEPGAAANAIVIEARRANVGDVSAADMTQAGPTAEMRSAEMRSAEMRSTEMTATTVATATVAAAAAACKGVGRETQSAKGDARQEHACHFVGYHVFSPDTGPRVCTRRMVHPNLGLCVEEI